MTYYAVPVNKPQLTGPTKPSCRLVLVRWNGCTSAVLILVRCIVACTAFLQWHVDNGSAAGICSMEVFLCVLLPRPGL